jgi:hypothetical protein
MTEAKGEGPFLWHWRVRPAFRYHTCRLVSLRRKPLVNLPKNKFVDEWGSTLLRRALFGRSYLPTLCDVTATIGHSFSIALFRDLMRPGLFARRGSQLESFAAIRPRPGPWGNIASDLGAFVFTWAMRPTQLFYATCIEHVHNPQ